MRYLFFVVLFACVDPADSAPVPSSWSVIDDCGTPPVAPSMNVVEWPASEACISSSEYADWESYARRVSAWQTCAAKH